MTSAGDLVGGRYRLGSLVAGGGMGQVWRAHDTLLGRTVAVKLLRREFTGDPAFLQRFRAEARHAALLNDPHIAAVHDYGEVAEGGGTLPYLVMELVQGVPLSDLLLREGRLGIDRSLRIVRQTAAGLAAAHAAGVVHRDVKPGNVLVTADDDVKITDFGIAWSAASVHLTQTGQVLGTAHYLSPEQADGAPATPASDVYALGVVAYQCLSGRVPFEAETPVQIALLKIRDAPPPLPPDVPADVRRLVAAAMARDPAARLPDGAAVRDAVDALSAAPSADRHPTAVLAAPLVTGPATTPQPLAGGTAVHPAVDTGEQDERPRGRRTRVAVAGAVVAAALVVAGVSAALGGEAPTAPADATGTPTATATTTAPAPPATVRLDSAALVGRPVADVEAELVALGLQVQRRPLTTGDVADGQVIAVDPAGELVPGSVVALTHAVAPAPPPAPAPAPAPAPDPEEQEDGGGGEDDPGNGNGNGNGRDKDKEKDDDG